MNRKQRRTLRKQMGKEATSTLDLMLSLPENCLTCNKPYDKKDKQMVMTWFVEVFSSQKRVDLYCPQCHEEKANGRKENSIL